MSAGLQFGNSGCGTIVCSSPLIAAASLFSYRPCWIVVKLCCIICSFKSSLLKIVGTENRLYLERKQQNIEEMAEGFPM